MQIKKMLSEEADSLISSYVRENIILNFPNPSSLTFEYYLLYNSKAIGKDKIGNNLIERRNGYYSKDFLIGFNIKNMGIYSNHFESTALKVISTDKLHELQSRIASETYRDFKDKYKELLVLGVNDGYWGFSHEYFYVPDFMDRVERIFQLVWEGKIKMALDSKELGILKLIKVFKKYLITEINPKFLEFQTELFETLKYFENLNQNEVKELLNYY